MDQEPVDSRYPKLDLPRFESKIPAHLLNRMSEQEKWLVETLSKLDQKADWFMGAIVRTNQIEREIDVRLNRIEKFTSKWAMVGAAGMLLVTAFLGALAKSAIAHIWP